jgi:hypothetical protein
MKWFDLRSGAIGLAVGGAIGLAVGGLLVSALVRFEKEPVPHHTGFKLGKYEPTELEVFTEKVVALLFRDDGVVEVEIEEKNSFNEPILVPGSVGAKREAYIGKWNHSGGLIEVEAEVEYRNPRTNDLSPKRPTLLQQTGFTFKFHFRQSRSNPDSPVQLILVRKNDQDLLRSDFETWKWVGE